MELEEDSPCWAKDALGGSITSLSHEITYPALCVAAQTHGEPATTIPLEEPLETIRANSIMLKDQS